jgi:hypothetical protein
MNEAGKFSLIKPTIQTPFRIDFDWWKKNDHNWRVYLFSFLCENHQKAFEGSNEEDVIDVIDPRTAEVTMVDRLQYTLMNHCARQEDFLTDNTTLVNAVFRTFLANGNASLTPVELGEHINKDPDMILRTLSGPRIYQGIRPVG